MSLEVENPDEDEDPVESTLLQFDESDEHIEVTKSTPNGGVDDPGHIDISFDVARRGV